MNTLIEVQGFKKSFFVPGIRRKLVEAVKDISLSVNAGEIYGFLGPNGAGKMTTIKALLGLIRPTAGTIRVLGASPDDLSWRSQVGYLPETPYFYEYLSGLELVTWFGRLAGLNAHEASQQAKARLERVGLAHAMTRPVRKYSKGMLQRTGLAQSLIGDPKLLILDEPMTGLDPIGRRDIRELLLELRAEGRTVFYSTHILPDVEMTCDRVAIIHQGRVIQEGALSEILTSTIRGVSVSLVNLAPPLLEQLKLEQVQHRAEGNVVQAEFKTMDSAVSFVGEAQRQGARLERLEPHRMDLEEIFVSSLGADFEKLRRDNR